MIYETEDNTGTMKNFRFIIFILISTLSVGTTQKRIDESVKRESETAQYTVNDQPAVTMKINVWGEVNYPGQYLIPYTMKVDIMSILSIAGGPTSEANLKKVVLIKSGDEPGYSSKTVIHINDYFDADHRNEIPELGPNDTVIIHKTVMGRLNANQSIISILQLIATVYLIING